jgi:hypothetical protein
MINKTKQKTIPFPDNLKIIRGTLIERYVKCRNKKCPCQKGDKIHGPNWYVVYRENNKTIHVYIAKKHLKQIRKMINNYSILMKKIYKISKSNLKKIKGSEV